MTADRFPVLLSYKDPRHDRQRYARKRFSVPWDAVAPHERQAQRNHSQSLARLAERGGLSWTELLAVLEDREWTAMDEAVAERRVREAAEVAEEPRP